MTKPLSQSSIHYCCWNYLCSWISSIHYKPWWAVFHDILTRVTCKNFVKSRTMQTTLFLCSYKYICTKIYLTPLCLSEWDVKNTKLYFCLKKLKWDFVRIMRSHVTSVQCVLLFWEFVLYYMVVKYQLNHQVAIIRLKYFVWKQMSESTAGHYFFEIGKCLICPWVESMKGFDHLSKTSLPLMDNIACSRHALYLYYVPVNLVCLLQILEY